jgi:heterodisulfide reductase subunit A
MDTLLGTQVEVDADLVVLATGVAASAGAKDLAEKLRISYDEYGFYMESHPKLRPVETNTAGVFLAGVCQGPKDIPASVAQGSAAAAKTQALFSRDTIETDPQIASVNERMCIGCGKCIDVCPFGSIQWKTLRDGSQKAEVLDTVCQGCGLCNATCPPKAIQLQHCTDDQILAEIDVLCAGERHG